MKIVEIGQTLLIITFSNSIKNLTKCKTFCCIGIANHISNPGMVGVTINWKIYFQTNLFEAPELSIIL